MPNSLTSPEQLLADSVLVHGAEAVNLAVDRLANDINQAMQGKLPLVMCVMGGAVVFSGQLLPKLNFPLQFDYVQVSRYHNQTSGQYLDWKVLPRDNVQGRTVLLLDDILDEGHTLVEIKQKCIEQGAEQVIIAVLAEKNTGRSKPIKADFVGISVPNKYVFGCGMDVYGWWRNLPAIYALKD